MTPQEYAEKALALTRSDRAVVLVEQQSSANVRWAESSVTTNGDLRALHVTVVAVRDAAGGSRVGVVSRVVADLPDLEAVVAAADAAAVDAEPSPDAAPFAAVATSHDWADPVPVTSAGALRGLVGQLAESFDRTRGEGVELFGYAEHSLDTLFLASSDGHRLRHVQPDGKIEVTGKSHARSRSAWVGRHAPDPESVSLRGLDDELLRFLEWQARRVEVPAGPTTAVLTPSATADLAVYVYWSASARDAHEGRTVFSRPGGGTLVGESVADPRVRVWSDPGLADERCAPFVAAAASTSTTSVFDNGLGVGSTDWIRDGRLTALLQTRHSAGLTGLAATPYVDNLALAVDGGSGDYLDLVAGMGRGLLINTLWYIREVDPQTLLLTGLTRDGVYLVEGGEVVGAAGNYRFNERPVDLLRRIDAAGSTATTLPREWSDDFTRIATPALRVADFHLSTPSQAS